MPYRGQITHFNLHVPTIFWIDILYKYNDLYLVKSWIKEMTKKHKRKNIYPWLWPLYNKINWDHLSFSGAYGTVYKARDRASDKIVAIKKVKLALTEDGVPMSVLREISLLKQLGKSNHPNIVRWDSILLIFVFVSKNLQVCTNRTFPLVCFCLQAGTSHCQRNEWIPGPRRDNTEYAFIYDPVSF